MSIRVRVEVRLRVNASQGEGRVPPHLSKETSTLSLRPNNDLSPSNKGALAKSFARYLRGGPIKSSSCCSGALVLSDMIVETLEFGSKLGGDI